MTRAELQWQYREQGEATAEFTIGRLTFLIHLKASNGTILVGLFGVPVYRVEDIYLLPLPDTVEIWLAEHGKCRIRAVGQCRTGDTAALDRLVDKAIAIAHEHAASVAAQHVAQQDSDSFLREYIARG